MFSRLTTKPSQMDLPTLGDSQPVSIEVRPEVKRSQIDITFDKVGLTSTKQNNFELTNLQKL